MSKRQPDSHPENRSEDRGAEELTALKALSRDLTRELSLPKTIAAALKSLHATLQPDLAFLFLRDGDNLVLRGISPDEDGRSVAEAGDHKVGQCLCGLSVGQRRALYSLDIHDDQRCTWNECKAAGVQSFAAIPLFSADEVIGVIGLASRSRREFQARADFLETLAGQVAVAVSNARLLEKAQSELEQHQQTLAALRESQDRYKALSDLSPLAICLISKDGQYEYLNQAYTNMFGYTLDDIPTREEWFRRAYPDEEYRQEVMGAWQRDQDQLGPGQVASYTLNINTKKGERKNILLRVVTLSSGDHFIIYEDITAFITSKRSLRESEERFRQFVEHSPVAVAITNPGHIIEYINPRFSQTYGYEPADIPDLDTWWIKAYPDPAYRREVMVDWNTRVQEAHLTGRNVVQVERRVRCKDGTDKIVAFYGAPVGDKTMIVLLDVTAERDTTRALKDSEARFRRFVEATPVGIHTYRLGTDGRLVFSGYNPAADRILGIDHGPLLGQSILDAFPALADSEVPAHYRRAAEQGIVWRDEQVTYEHGRVTGAYEVIAFQTEPGAMAAMFSDISQRLKDQEELRILEQQLFHSQKLEALGTLASGIAHDFNNILQALSGRAELLVGAQDTPETSRLHIEKMRQSIDRATRLVAKMLSFSRAGESKLSVLDLNQEVASAVEMLSHTLPKMVDIQVELSPEPCPIKADSNRLEQVILNLATNARDAMPDGGSLRFKTALRDLTGSSKPGKGPAPGKYVALEVSDSGEGMEINTLDRIFEPFFTTKESGKGTGLGLYSAFGIIREHGGTISCQSRPGRGTTFTMLFPHVQGPGEAAKTGPQGSDFARGRGETILVVDDDLEVLSPLSEALEAQGYRTLRAVSGEEALACLDKPGLEIDAILMDLNMPGMGGEKALGQIRRDHPNLRIMIASGYQDQALRDRVLQNGADRFIGKPFEMRELLAALRKVMEEKP